MGGDDSVGGIVIAERRCERWCRPLAWALLAFASLGASHASERVEVVDFSVATSDDKAQVSYRLEGTIPEDVIERLQAGIAITFRHRVDLILRRSFLLAPSRLLHRCEIETTATYDSLTKQYALERTTRHRPFGGQEEDAVVERQTTDRVDVVRSWMTQISDVEIPLTGLDPDQRERSRVRVFSLLGRRYLLLVFPTSITAAAETELVS
jgi:hypothetical protein